MTDSKFNSILKRGIAEIINEAELMKLLESGRILNLKQGFDPSAPDIHLGHVVGLRKLRQFQELGHKVTLIVGDWTARIGDPSGQSTTRPILSQDQIQNNAQTYLEQFFKVVDKDRTEIRWQSEWYNKFTLDEIIRLSSKFTVAQLLAREDFNKRYSSGNPISLAEMLYPLLQAYDSVVIQADVEFGGIDQKFNCLLGRELQKIMGQPPQQVFLVPLLIGTDGNQKMSKSLGNYIGIKEPPQEVYGKVMSIPDSLIIDYFELVTDAPDKEIAEIKEQMNNGSINPMSIKKRLAHEIVKQFNDEESASEAEQYFSKVFQKKETPQEIAEHLFPSRYIGDALYEIDIAPTLIKEGIVRSKGELKRLLSQKAIELNGDKINDSIINARHGSILRIGKRNFVRIAVR
ncbi:MAG: tyrosine--tRNA ligase [Chloroflexi bacterium CG_4_9_14_3_um_filter_45_9]|nr:MAG: tyrosine--tRNA ligase [Dehalococcoidia bacterium CG2_30_46_9]PIU23643.1 MAG: tyrosine--tRNA ligase [Chloroflexi bacterium CG08_land_8_20_14_0_20_45_12]PIX27135.1 MAG: tyrosine--tRNA ligase [Chloroflexi bacterium CG_4_8_14_3_um_filter_45_15]PJB49197.1 MAG: tyrosine--tRNA ligase [Chloroflexi bacterium CG_4_9_14_3_um_filter_45_9]